MHHVIVRGVARSVIAVDEIDYEQAIDYLQRTILRFELQCQAWCYMPNHTHLLLTSQLGNLSDAMQWLGTCTAQAFNERHERAGHLYQGRFTSRLVEDDGYHLELARYLPLNPVRAQLCRAPEDWPWSSYAATAGVRVSPWYLEASAFLRLLGSPDAYVDWVAEGIDTSRLDEAGLPKPPWRPSLASLLTEISDASIACAHFEHGYSKEAIGRQIGESRWQVGRRLARFTK